MVRYWFGDNKTAAVVENIDFSEAYQKESIGSKEWAILGKLLTCTGQDMADVTSRDAQIEVILVPGKGSPMTYATYLYDSAKKRQSVTGYFIPQNITISAAEGSETLGRWDGILEADDIEYKDSDSNIITQDLGYGFIGTEEHFTTSVPNGTDKIFGECRRRCRF